MLCKADEEGATSRAGVLADGRNTFATNSSRTLFCVPFPPPFPIADNDLHPKAKAATTNPWTQNRWPTAARTAEASTRALAPKRTCFNLQLAFNIFPPKVCPCALKGPPIWEQFRSLFLHKTQKPHFVIFFTRTRQPPVAPRSLDSPTNTTTMTTAVLPPMSEITPLLKDVVDNADSSQVTVADVLRAVENKMSLAEGTFKEDPEMNEQLCAYIDSLLGAHTNPDSPIDKTIHGMDSPASDGENDDQAANKTADTPDSGCSTPMQMDPAAEKPAATKASAKKAAGNKTPSKGQADAPTTTEWDEAEEATTVEHLKKCVKLTGSRKTFAKELAGKTPEEQCEVLANALTEMGVASPITLARCTEFKTAQAAAKAASAATSSADESESAETIAAAAAAKRAAAQIASIDVDASNILTEASGGRARRATAQRTLELMRKVSESAQAKIEGSDDEEDGNAGEDDDDDANEEDDDDDDAAEEEEDEDDDEEEDEDDVADEEEEEDDEPTRKKSKSAKKQPSSSPAKKPAAATSKSPSSSAKKSPAAKSPAGAPKAASPASKATTAASKAKSPAKAPATAAAKAKKATTDDMEVDDDDSAASSKNKKQATSDEEGDTAEADNAGEDEEADEEAPKKKAAAPKKVAPATKKPAASPAATTTAKPAIGGGGIKPQIGTPRKGLGAGRPLGARAGFTPPSRVAPAATPTNTPTKGVKRAAKSGDNQEDDEEEGSPSKKSRCSDDDEDDEGNERRRRDAEYEDC
ncbi:hypothetical protein CAOG_006203 [Capsaspora owczarzaki ATCC 30864]|uniref:Uncharacterized protein n=2 Tax=Capsaspora owczarzaki (strain ATCC 30864) TaxID=595528 RepID=A0A0D2VW79_CAPO3|nr:hypothetical protein CAOG_006203 [Capsaspora owczarzaki ATCC 30864]